MTRRSSQTMLNFVVVLATAYKERDTAAFIACLRTLGAISTSGYESVRMSKTIDSIAGALQAEEGS